MGGDGEHSGLDSHLDPGLNDCLSEACGGGTWNRRLMTISESVEWVVCLWPSVGSCLSVFW